MTAPLIYRTFEVRVVDSPAAGETMHDTALNGVKTMLTGTSWELLPGPAQQVDVDPADWAGEKLVGYRWPVAEHRQSRADQVPSDAAPYPSGGEGQ